MLYYRNLDNYGLRPGTAIRSMPLVQLSVSWWTSRSRLDRGRRDDVAPVGAATPRIIDAVPVSEFRLPGLHDSGTTSGSGDSPRSQRGCASPSRRASFV